MCPMTKLREPEPVSTGSAADFIPPNPTLPRLREAARGCRGCNLWVNATQTVFGEGSSRAEVMLIGEAPGDVEDRAGHPFVGRRLHKKPNAAEVRACNPWLREEIRLVQPKVIVALGATAAQALLGKQFRVTQQRGKPMPSEVADAIIATVHPSAVLRAPDDERERARREFVADLKRVAAYLRRPKAKAAGSR